MNPESFKAWTDAAMPTIDRGMIVAAVGVVLYIGWKLEWRKFFNWISAPTMSSLVFVSAFCIAAQSFLSSDEMYKYVNAYVLVLARFIFGAFGGGFVALKAYRMKPDDAPPKEQPKSDGDKTP